MRYLIWTASRCWSNQVLDMAFLSDSGTQAVEELLYEQEPGANGFYQTLKVHGTWLFYGCSNFLSILWWSVKLE
jgi:hypothetical protein